MGIKVIEQFKRYFSKYLFISGIAYLVDFIGFALLIVFFDPISSNILTKILAALTGFYLHSKFTYNTPLNNKSIILKYFGALLLYTPISSILIYIFLFFLHPFESKILSDIILFLITFFLTTKFIFKR